MVLKRVQCGLEEDMQKRSRERGLRGPMSATASRPEARIHADSQCPVKEWDLCAGLSSGPDDCV